MSEKESKKQSKKTKSKISHFVIQRLAIATVLINIVMLVVVSNLSKSALETKEQAFLSEKIDNITTTIESTLAEYIAISDIVAIDADVITLLQGSTASNPMRNQEVAGNVVALTAGIVNKFPAIVNVGVCDVDEDAYFLHDGSTSASSFSYRTREYYSVVTTKQTMITDPYVDTVTNDLVVTIASPIISSNGTVLGGTFVDLSIAFIIDLVGNSGFGDTGKNLIADKDGNLIACMDLEHIGSSYSNLGVSGATLQREVASPTGSFFELETNGATSIGAVSGINGTDWALVTSIEQWEYNEDINNIQISFIVLIAASIIITLTAAGLTVTSALKPLEFIRTAMSELSQGNTHYKLEYRSNNEIGGLADDLRFTTNNLANYIDEIDRQLDSCGNGDFTVSSDMEFLGDFARIQSSIRNFIYLISNALNGMKATVAQVSIGSGHVASGAQSLAEGSNEQSNSVVVLNEKISEINTNVSKNAENVKHVNECSQETADKLRVNSEKMRQMVISMSEINRTSEGIQKIVKTIEDVAFQTNILALNAAVEAARAGTAGKGFAVVAEEVRNLSSRTSEAVKETTRLIEETSAAVKQGSDIVDETAKGLQEIIEFVESFIGSLMEITQASEEQANAIEDVNQNVITITTVMQSNSAISEQSAATSEELSSQATVMRDTIEQFKTNQ